MTSIEEAQVLMKQLISYREIASASNKSEDIKLLKKHESLCVQKFSYLITMRASRYRNFPNYEDLKQEGMEALLKAMSSYNPEKAPFYFWAHKYIGTRISRCANQHTPIRYPLKYAKLIVPRRELKFPLLIDKTNPEKDLEKNEIDNAVGNAIKLLNEQQKNIVLLTFGFNGSPPLTLERVSKKMRITTPECEEILCCAIDILKKNIKI